MKPTDFWKNFELGEEISVSGAFIYDGIRRFHELKKLDYPDEIFEVFYHFAMGLERLLKIAVVLLEHDDKVNQHALEESLITHNHLGLLHRIQKHVELRLDTPHNEFLALLSTFYKSFRYDRFSLSSVSDMDKERNALCSFLAKHLQVQFPERNNLFGTPNEVRYKKFVHKIVLKISSEVFAAIRERASELGLYTYELRNGSKAETVFLGEADIIAEDLLWKELLIFFMNTKGTSGYLRFLREIPPLEFDPERVDDYLDCFQSDVAKAFIVGELEHNYGELKDKSSRLNLMSAIGAPGVSFDEEDNEEDSEI
jgi:hypothetical protein